MKTVGTGQYKAIWTAELPEDGKYEVFAMHQKSTFVFGGNLYGYTISGEGKASEEVHREFEPGGWVSLGEFYFKQGKATVELDDRLIVKKKDNEKDTKQGKMPLQVPKIVADAVKWVKIGQ